MIRTRVIVKVFQAQDILHSTVHWSIGLGDLKLEVLMKSRQLELGGWKFEKHIIHALPLSHDHKMTPS